MISLAKSQRNPTFECAGRKLSRLWHCFGNYMHTVDLSDVVAMLAASETNVLPVNTHRLDKRRNRDDLLIGFGGVTYDLLSATVDTGQMIKMVNINHQTIVEDVVDKTLLAYELTGEPVIKLELLRSDLKRSNDAMLVKAVEQLSRRAPQLVLMPLVSNNALAARDLIALNCPLLRVMGGPIGSGSGIADRDTFAELCALAPHVVLDGGVGSAADVVLARKLGADGCLVNSMLFMDPRGPAATLQHLVDECASALRISEAA
jgi:thiazole synthase